MFVEFCSRSRQDAWEGWTSVGPSASVGLPTRYSTFTAARGYDPPSRSRRSARRIPDQSRPRTRVGLLLSQLTFAKRRPTCPARTSTLTSTEGLHRARGAHRLPQPVILVGGNPKSVGAGGSSWTQKIGRSELRFVWRAAELLTRLPRRWCSQLTRPMPARARTRELVQLGPWTPPSSGTLPPRR